MKYELHGFVVQGNIKHEFTLENGVILGQWQGKDCVPIKVGIKGAYIEKFFKAVVGGPENKRKHPISLSFLFQEYVLCGIFSIIFGVTSNKETWKPVVEYGLSIGIPLEQLDFFPAD